MTLNPWEKVWEERGHELILDGPMEDHSTET